MNPTGSRLRSTATPAPHLWRGPAKPGRPYRYRPGRDPEIGKTMPAESALIFLGLDKKTVARLAANL